MKKLLLIIIAIAILGGVVFALSTLPKRNFFSGGKNSFISSPAPTETLSPKRIIGFLPYWQLAGTDQSRFSILTDVFFFGVHFDEKGVLDAKEIERLRSTSFTLLQKTADTTLVLILQDNEKIEQFLEDKKAWDTFIKEVNSLIATYNLGGINIDVEYSGIPAKTTIAGFTEFMSHVTKRVKETNPNIIVSVDMTADSVRKSRLYNVENIAREVDYILLMGYDFYKPGSSVAGPVAPLTGKEIYEYDVLSAIEDFLTVVPKEKLILGVPYYGWDFPTSSEERGSFVEQRSDSAVALATYRRTRMLLAEGKVTLRFDEESQTPWMTYKDPETGTIRQIWFEDENSLGKKYDVVNSRGLGGIAIWALGYDGDYSELDNLLRAKFPR